MLAGTRPVITQEHQEYVLKLLNEGVIWRGVRFLTKRNYAGPLLHRLLKDLPPDLIPAPAKEDLRQSYLRTYQRNMEFASVLETVQAKLEEARLKGVFLRGLGLAELEYGNPALRWFSDVDLLVAPSDVPKATEVLEALGGVSKEGSLADGYHLRNHFHIQRVMDGGNGATIELHWNLDHYYTMFTLDVEGMIERSQMERIGKATIPVLEPSDKLMGLCLHIVKHCPAARHYPRSPLLARRVLLDGWLTQMVDIAMALERHRQIDWEVFAANARAWGTEEVAYSALCAASLTVNARVPAEALSYLRVPTPGNRLERALTKMFLDPDQTLSPAGTKGKMAQWLLVKWKFQDDAVFHPLRLLDLANFFFPRPKDLSRWLRRPRLKPIWFWRIVHVVSGSWKLARGAADLIFFRLVLMILRLFGRRPPSQPPRYRREPSRS